MSRIWGWGEHYCLKRIKDVEGSHVSGNERHCFLHLFWHTLSTLQRKLNDKSNNSRYLCIDSTILCCMLPTTILDMPCCVCEMFIFNHKGSWTLTYPKLPPCNYCIMSRGTYDLFPCTSKLLHTSFSYFIITLLIIL